MFLSLSRYKSDLHGPEGGCVSLQLQRIFVLMAFSPRSVVSPRPLTDAFGWTAQDLRAQQDAQELLCVLFDRLDFEAAVAGIMGPSRSFRMRKVTRVSCGSCGNSTIREESAIDLPLPVEGAASLSDALVLSEMPEVLCGENKLKCDACGQYSDAAIATSVEPPCPGVLAVHLRRFGYDFVAKRRVKVSTRFEFPQTLSLFEHRERASDTPLDLVCVLAHRGTAFGGHYLAFVRGISASTGMSRWFLVDDERATPCEVAAVTDCFGGSESKPMLTAYMLMYARSPQARMSAENLQSQLSDFLNEDTARFVAALGAQEEESAKVRVGVVVRGTKFSILADTRRTVSHCFESYLKGFHEEEQVRIVVVDEITNAAIAVIQPDDILAPHASKRFEIQSVPLGAAFPPIFEPSRLLRLSVWDSAKRTFSNPVPLICPNTVEARDVVAFIAEATSIPRPSLAVSGDRPPHIFSPLELGDAIGARSIVFVSDGSKGEDSLGILERSANEFRIVASIIGDGWTKSFDVVTQDTIGDLRLALSDAAGLDMKDFNIRLAPRKGAFLADDYERIGDRFAHDDRVFIEKSLRILSNQVRLNFWKVDDRTHSLQFSELFDFAKQWCLVRSLVAARLDVPAENLRLRERSNLSVGRVLRDCEQISECVCEKDVVVEVSKSPVVIVGPDEVLVVAMRYIPSENSLTKGVEVALRVPCSVSELFSAVQGQLGLHPVDEVDVALAPLSHVDGNGANGARWHPMGSWF